MCWLAGFVSKGFHVRNRKVVIFDAQIVIWEACCPILPSLGVIFASGGYPGRPWEQQDGHVGIQGRIFNVFGMILGAHFDKCSGTEDQSSGVVFGFLSMLLLATIPETKSGPVALCRSAFWVPPNQSDSIAASGDSLAAASIENTKTQENIVTSAARCPLKEGGTGYISKISARVAAREGSNCSTSRENSAQAQRVFAWSA